MINKIGLIMGIIGLILSTFWGVMYYNNKKHTKEVIEKGTQALATLEESAKIRQDSINLEISKRDSTIKNMVSAQKETKEALNIAVGKSKSLAVDLKKAKVNRDTTTYYAKCDSLSDQIVLLEAENGAYQSKVESLNLNYQSQLESKDSLIKSKDELYGRLREAFAGSTLKINEIETTNRKLSVKLERSKRTSRVIALLGIAATGTIYLTTR